MIVVGAALALWSLSGAMQTVMWSINRAYEQQERAGRPGQGRSLLMALCGVAAVALVVVAVVLEPFDQQLDRQQHRHVGGANWLWEIGRFPILVAALLASLGSVLYLAPDVLISGSSSSPQAR